MLPAGNDRPAPEATEPPGLTELFREFLSVGVSGFGGAMPFGRRMLVERRCWLTEAEFNELMSLCQFLPGPNIVNVSLAVGLRFRGLLGALAAITGILGVPVLLVVGAGILYDHFGHFAVVDRALRGIAVVAAGLVFATGVKMSRALPRAVAVWAFFAASCLTVGLLHLPLGWVLPALAVLSVSWAWQRERTG